MVTLIDGLGATGTVGETVGALVRFWDNPAVGSINNGR